MSIASSIVSSIQQPDPSEAGLFNAPPRPRLRNYQKLGSAYTYVLVLSHGFFPRTLIPYARNSGFSIGDNNTAIYHFGVLLDPLSEAAQKFTSLFEVRSFFEVACMR